MANTVEAENEYQRKLRELCAREALSDWLSLWRKDREKPLEVLDAFIAANNISDRKERMRELERVWNDYDYVPWGRIEDDHCSDIIGLVIESYTKYLRFADEVKGRQS